MTCYRNEFTRHSIRLDSFGNRRRAYFRNIAINNACELVEDHHFRFGNSVAEGLCQIASKFFTVAQNVIGLDPTRWRTEPHRRKQFRDFLDRHVAETVDDGLVLRPISFGIQIVAEKMFGDRAFAAAGRADDQTDFSRLRQRWVFNRKRLRRFGFNRNVEHSGNLRNAKSTIDGTGYGELHFRCSEFCI